MIPPVLVTGATGRIGGQVIDQLLDSGVPVRALVRTLPEAALPSGVEVVTGDLGEPESLDGALAGVGAASRIWAATSCSRPHATQ